MHTRPRLSLKDACSWWVMTPAGGCALPVGVICSPPSLHTHSCVCCEDAVPLPPSLPSPLDQDERENCKIQILRYVSGYTRWDMCQLSVLTEVFYSSSPPLPPSSLPTLTSPLMAFWMFPWLRVGSPMSFITSSLSSEWAPEVCDFQPIT